MTMQQPQTGRLGVRWVLVTLLVSAGVVTMWQLSSNAADDTTKVQPTAVRATAVQPAAARRIISLANVATRVPTAASVAKQLALDSLTTTHQFVKAVSIPADETADPASKSQIHTFCVDKKGRLIVSSGGSQIVYVNGTPEMVTLPAAIYVFEPDGTPAACWKLDAAPQALAVAPNGTIYIAGIDGNVHQLNESGKVLRSFASPHLKALPPLTEFPEESDETPETRAAREAKRAEIQAKIAELSKQAQAIRVTQQAAVKENDEDAKIKAATALESVQNELMPLYQARTEVALSPRQIAMQERNRLLQAHSIKSIAVSTDAIYLCAPVSRGYGTEVWRLDMNGENPTVVVKNLSGCCGQMNIAACGDKLIIPENGKMSVHICDRDGNKLATWGKKSGVSGDESDESAFGSCCNPMNLTFDADGNVLTSEASVGVIKRFTQDGKYLEAVAVSKIVPGCKHTPIGLSPDGKTAYMLDLTQRQIFLFAR